MGTIYVQDAALSMAQAGLFYIVLSETGNLSSNELPVVVRITNYSTISVCPYPFWFALGLSDGVYPVGYFNIQASNVTPNIFYLATVANTSVSPSWRSVYLHKFTWGTWTPISGGYLMPTMTKNIGSNIATTVFVPYFKSDGTVNNPETEIYYMGGSMSGTSGQARVQQSLDGGTTFAAWGMVGPRQTSEINSAATRRDMFEVQGETNEMAFLIFEGGSADGFYYIPRGLDPLVDGNWIYKPFPSGVTRVAWVGGWPFTDSQFYFGTGSLKYPYTGLTHTVFLTLDSGVTFLDVSHNLRSLINYAGHSGDRHRVIRLIPHWTET
jgi:hypothetical protein